MALREFIYNPKPEIVRGGRVTGSGVTQPGDTERLLDGWPAFSSVSGRDAGAASLGMVHKPGWCYFFLAGGAAPPAAGAAPSSSFLPFLMTSGSAGGNSSFGSRRDFFSLERDDV